MISVGSENGYQADVSYLIWAFITYQDPDTGSLIVGGTSTGIHVDLS